MVTGNEYIFDNIDQALDYVLDTERRALAADDDTHVPDFDKGFVLKEYKPCLI